MKAWNHLDPSAREIADLPAQERIIQLRGDRWVDHPLATRALERLERLFETPPRTRMPCCLIFGESGMGKTMIVEKFKRAHPRVYRPERGIEQIDVLAFQMPPIPSQSRFYGQILQALGAPYRPGDRLFAVETVALRLLKQIRPRVLIVDEVHHLLSGSAREQRGALNLLKFIANELQCAVAALGTYDARTAMQTDAQIESRFEPLELPRWTDGEALRRFLLAYERLLPLREPSNLAEPACAQLILARSGGITGNITETIIRAAELALHESRERVRPELIEAVAGMTVP
jgi:hypothetical protein